MSKQSEKNKEQGESYLKAAFTGLIVVAIVQAFWPEFLPYKLSDFWKAQGSIMDWLWAGLPIFIWGTGVTAVLSLLTRNSKKENDNAELLFAGDVLISLWAGFMEEICFRWLIFLNAIVGMKVVNFLFFGWLGFGIAEWFQIHVFGWLANLATLGYLQTVLTNPETWAVGAGLLSANALFRNGHKYLGPIGFVNSWFIGMYMFFLLFNYGLWACILVHFLYDLLIFAVRFVDRAVERAMASSK
jgi:hypothetical protein